MDSENLVAFKAPTTAYHRLSAQIVAKSQPRQKEYFVRDAELRGFFLRVRPSGVKSYGVLSRLGRKGNKIERIIGHAGEPCLRKLLVHFHYRGVYSFYLLNLPHK